MTYILAGTHQQAIEYARQAGLKPNDYRYVDRVDQLRGTRDPVCVMVGSFFSRDDAQDILEMLEILQSRAYREQALSYQPTPVKESDDFDRDLPIHPNIIDEDDRVDESYDARSLEEKLRSNDALMEEMAAKVKAFDTAFDRNPNLKTATFEYEWNNAWDSWPEVHGR